MPIFLNNNRDSLSIIKVKCITVELKRYYYTTVFLSAIYYIIAAVRSGTRRTFTE